MAYPFRAARYQYGPRKGTLGLALHMSEGGDGLVDYLAGNPARGVSANFALLSTGEMWRMMAYETASGSLNPADRSTNKGYYGHDYLVDILGNAWTDPNAYVISVEIAGKASIGPTQRQIDSLGAWAADMRRLFPTLRGAFGHADQTDTKPCPGTTPAMKAAFEAVGGHGLWPVAEKPMNTFTVDPKALRVGTLTVGDPGHWYLRLKDGAKFPISPGPAWIDRPAYGPVTLTPDIDGKATTGDRALAYLVGTEAAAVLATDCVFTEAPDASPFSQADVDAAVLVDRAKAKIVYS